MFESEAVAMFSPSKSVLIVEEGTQADDFYPIDIFRDRASYGYINSDNPKNGQKIWQEKKDKIFMVSNYYLG